jgi:hypothetical protein
MKIYEVTNEKFKKYGKVLSGYDFSELFHELSKTEIPKEGIVYVRSEKAFEETAVFDEIEKRGFGSLPVQIGYCNGKNKILNCLEYHKTGEFNIALDDVILILGCVWDIEKDGYDTKNCEAFLLPAGVGVEFYATTLHYAPISTSDKGFRVACVLPRLTNAEQVEFCEKTDEDKLCLGLNKWVLAHPNSPDAKNGAYPFLKGENIEF